LKVEIRRRDDLLDDTELAELEFDEDRCDEDLEDDSLVDVNSDNSSDENEQFKPIHSPINYPKHTPVRVSDINDSFMNPVGVS